MTNAHHPSPPVTMAAAVCPACGGPTELTDRFCGHCGHEIAVAPRRTDPRLAASNSQTTTGIVAESSVSPKKMSLGGAFVELLARLVVLITLIEVVRQPIQHANLAGAPIYGYLILLPLAILGALSVFLGLKAPFGAALVTVCLIVLSYLYWFSAQRLLLDLVVRSDIAIYDDAVDPNSFYPSLHSHIVSTLAVFAAMLFIMVHGAGRLSIDQILRSRRGSVRV